MLPKIAGVQPSVGVQRLGGGLGLVEIAGHHAIAAREDLADGAHRHDIAGMGIDNLHFGLRQRLADRGNPVRVRVIGMRVGDVGGCLRLPEADGHLHAELGLRAAHQLGRHRSAPQRGQPP